MTTQSTPSGIDVTALTPEQAKRSIAYLSQAMMGSLSKEMGQLIALFATISTTFTTLSMNQASQSAWNTMFSGMASGIGSGISGIASGCQAGTEIKSMADDNKAKSKYNDTMEGIKRDREALGGALGSSDPTAVGAAARGTTSEAELTRKEKAAKTKKDDALAATKSSRNLARQFGDVTKSIGTGASQLAKAGFDASSGINNAEQQILAKAAELFLQLLSSLVGNAEKDFDRNNPFGAVEAMAR